MNNRYWLKGYHMMKGAMFCLVQGLMIALAAVIISSLFRCAFNIGIDDSDKDGWHRSGFRILTDYKTGIEYLSDGHGGLIRRGQ